MAETVERHLRMRWGDTGVWVVTVTDSAGVAVNIAGATMKFTVKWRASDTDVNALFTPKTVGAGIALTTPASGIATVTVDSVDTAKLAAGREHLLLYDWKMTLSSQTTTVAYGTLLVESAMSRTAP